MPNATIEQSRVANKWNALLKVTNMMQDFLAPFGGIELTAVFANKGVLSGREVTGRDEKALLRHRELYKQTVQRFMVEKGIEGQFFSYDELGVSFPTFVNPLDDMPIPKEPLEIRKGDQAKRMIWCLNEYLIQNGVSTQIVGNRSNRKVIEKLLEMKGMRFNGVFWLVAGYLVFDHMIPKLIGDDGIYLSTERFEPLFCIARFTPSLKELTIVEIKA